MRKLLSLKHRISLERCDLRWVQHLFTKDHYVHKPVNRCAMPFAYAIALDGKAIGCIIMATPRWNRQRVGDCQSLATWQVLTIFRLWIHPKVQVRQPNGHASNIRACAIAKMLRRVQYGWTDHYPPIFPELPYHIRLAGAGHDGIVYRAANFIRWGITQKTKAEKRAGAVLVRAKRFCGFIACLNPLGSGRQTACNWS